jgi:hypothetical protein
VLGCMYVVGRVDVLCVCVCVWWLSCWLCVCKCAYFTLEMTLRPTNILSTAGEEQVQEAYGHKQISEGAII